VRLSELQNKDIINITNGKKIGNIIDISVNYDGSMKSLVVEKYKFLLSHFTTNKEIEIKWDQIKKIGDDVILVSI